MIPKKPALGASGFFAFAHVLIGKPVSTFPGHALSDLHRGGIAVGPPQQQREQRRRRKREQRQDDECTHEARERDHRAEQEWTGDGADAFDEAENADRRRLADFPDGFTATIVDERQRRV